MTAAKLSAIVVALLFILLAGGCITIEKRGGQSEQLSDTAGGATGAASAESTAIRNSPENNGFNIEVELPKSYQEIAPGNELWFTTKLMNLANQERRDVTLDYQLLNSQKQLLYSKSETVAVETQASFVAHILTPDTLQPGLHFLRVTVSSSLGNSEAETTFQVVAEEGEPQIVIKFSLFDIQVEIPENYKTVYPGNELLTSIRLINVGSSGRIDIFLEYWITDEKGEILLEEKETVAVETQNNFIRLFDLPGDAAPGRYIFHAKVSYPGVELEPEYATTFTIAKKKTPLWIYLSVAGLIALFLGILIIKMGVLKAIQEHREIRKKVYQLVKERHHEP